MYSTLESADWLELLPIAEFCERYGCTIASMQRFARDVEMMLLACMLAASHPYSLGSCKTVLRFQLAWILCSVDVPPGLG